MKQIEVQGLTDNFFTKISKEWMIVTAGTADSYNMMTASWGGIGWLWNKPVAFVFIRPERHTFAFLENQEKMTLSFLGKSDEARQIYQFCGSKSGKDVDKMKESGLTLLEFQQGAAIFEQAQLTLGCKKLYVDDMHESSFLDHALLDSWYGEHGGLHKMYVVEIDNVWVK